MLYHITFMGKHVVVIFRWNNQVVTLPVCPMNQVVADSKRVVGVVFPVGIVCREIKHHIKRRCSPSIGSVHLYNLCITRDGTI